MVRKQATEAGPAPSSDLSPLREGRRDRLVDAAERAFRHAGFRGASMEAIAREGQVSKATLYGYFPDKEAAFGAVAERLAARLLSGFEGALAHRRRPLAARIGDALVGKHRTVDDVVRRSAEAQDLFATQARISAATFATLDAKMTDRLADALRTGGVRDAARLARVLFTAAQGIANGADDPARMEGDVRLLVERLLGGGAA